MKKKQQILNAESKSLNARFRGDSLDTLANIEETNTALAKKEIEQQRDNL
ncbi:hypothetical protein [Niallia sp. 01092]